MFFYIDNKNRLKKLYKNVFSLDRDYLEQYGNVDDDRLFEISFKQGVTGSLLPLVSMHLCNIRNIYPQGLYLRQIIENICVSKYIADNSNQNLIDLFKKEVFEVEISLHDDNYVKMVSLFDKIIRKQYEKKIEYETIYKKLTDCKIKYPNAGTYLKVIDKNIKFRKLIKQYQPIGKDSLIIYDFLSLLLHGCLIDSSQRENVVNELNRITELVIKESIIFLNLKNYGRKEIEHFDEGLRVILNKYTNKCIPKLFKSGFDLFDDAINEYEFETMRCSDCDYKEATLSLYKPFITYNSFIHQLQLIENRDDIYQRMKQLSKKQLDDYLNKQKTDYKNYLFNEFNIPSIRSITKLETNYIKFLKYDFFSYLYDVSGNFIHGSGYQFNCSKGYFDKLFSYIPFAELVISSQ